MSITVMDVQLRNAESKARRDPTDRCLVNIRSALARAKRSDGHLDDFHAARAVWRLRAELGHFRVVSFAPIYRYNSAKTFSLVLNGQQLSPVQAARNPGYAGNPTQQIYFGERGSQAFKGFALLDLAVTYGVPVWRSAQPWIKFEMFNVMNNQKLIAWDTTITADAASARDEFGLPTATWLVRVSGRAHRTRTPHASRRVDGGRMFDVAIGFRF